MAKAKAAAQDSASTADKQLMMRWLQGEGKRTPAEAAMEVASAPANQVSAHAANIRLLMSEGKLRETVRAGLAVIVPPTPKKARAAK